MVTATPTPARHRVLAMGLAFAVAAAAQLVAGVACGVDEDTKGTTLTVTLPTFGAEVLDPARDNLNERRYYGHMYDRLFVAGPDGALGTELGALEGWNSDADATSYTLKLKKGMRWHDGSAITSGDVVFSLAHHSRTNVACAVCGTLGEAILEAEPIDRYRVAVSLLEPDVAFVSRLGPDQEEVVLLPAEYFDRVGEGFADSPIGSGPWKFESRVIEEDIQYEANVDYWNRDRVPGFQRLRLVLASDLETRLAMLRAGVVDMAPIDSVDVRSLKAEGFSIGGPRYVLDTTLRFFMSYDPEFLTARAEFREALILGMNLPPIIEQIYPPEAAAQAGGSAMFGPLTEGYDPALPPYQYDPDRARQLLQESGYDGESVYVLSIPVYDRTETPLINEMIADDWRSLGVDVTIVPSTYGLVKNRFLRRPQIFADLSPAVVFLGGHLNRPGGIINAIDRYLTSSKGSLLSYHDLEAGDRIYAELNAITDGEAREQRLRELNRELYEEYWAAPIVWRHEVWGLSPNLTGWQPTDGTSFDLHFETVRPVE